MRSLNQSIWFKEPDLKKVDNQDGSMRFDMNVAMTRPDAEEASR
jgi:type IV pilus assembly protein PilN